MIRLSMSDIEAAATEAGQKAEALGLHPDFLQCEVVVRDAQFGVLSQRPVGIEDLAMTDDEADVAIQADYPDDPEFAELVARIERGLADALLEVEDAAATQPDVAL